jgi:hypothetical protein
VGDGEVDHDVDGLGERAGEVEGVGGGPDLETELAGGVGDDAEDVVARGDDDPVVAGEVDDVRGLVDEAEVGGVGATAGGASRMSAQSQAMRSYTKVEAAPTRWSPRCQSTADR